MLVKYPATATMEASRLSYLFKLKEELRLWHNFICFGMSAVEAKAWRDNNYKPRLKSVGVAINENQVIAEKGEFWKPALGVNYVDNKIVYPKTLVKSNEGSRLVFLYGMQAEFIKAGQDITDLDDFRTELSEAKEAAKVGTFWKPDIAKDII